MPPDPRVPLRRMRLSLLCAAFVGAAGAPVAMRAQSLGPAAFDRVPHNAELRVQLRDRSILFGRFGGGAPDSLILVQPFGNSPGRAVATSSIAAAWYRRGWQTTKGMTLGAGIGAVVGAVIGAAIGDTGDLSRGQSMLWSSVTFGLAGGLSGIIAGGLTQRWERIRPARP